MRQGKDTDLDTYLKVCEQLGQEPDPNKMPLSLDSLPIEAQVAFFVYNYLPSTYAGMDAVFTGKCWDSFNLVMDLYEFEDAVEIFKIAKLIEKAELEITLEKVQQERKKAERKSSPEGKNFTHRVQG